MPSRCAALLIVAALAATAAASDVAVVKRVLSLASAGENRLMPDRWRAWGDGFQQVDGQLVCDNGGDASGQRGASQTVMLNQQHPEPIIASAWSRAAGVSGSPGGDYSLYLDLVYDDGTPLWGQTAPFDTGTHAGQRRQVVVLPERPVRQLTVHLLLRNRAGKAWFADAELRVVQAPQEAAWFDGAAVIPQRQQLGFQVRDVAAGSDFVRLERSALGLRLEHTPSAGPDGAMFHDVTVTDTTGQDRAITLVYAVPVPRAGLAWLDDPRRSTPVEAPREYVHATRFNAGANGRLSRYPFGAVAGPDGGVALGIDMAYPAFFRAGYNTATQELFLAYDLGLTAERPSAQIRFCRFDFQPAWGFRAALDAYYRLFPEAFHRRVQQQGLWMPFARISQVEGWEDFGFRFKEGDNEPQWDETHGILTFRYTEPMTWWMPMPPEMPRTLEAALAEARRRAEDGDSRAQALFSSGYHDASGRFVARLLDTPWCNGAVWSVNSMPGLSGEITDFGNKWNSTLRDKLYAPDASVMDGEYIDSSEGYVTDELNFRRDHFVSAQTPLTFSLDTHRPAIFRGLIAFEYVRAIADDLHAMGRLTMANSTPARLCWLAPLLDVLGSETDWNRGRWSPMSDADLLYRRALSRGKPYCFLMNTRFEEFPPELVERYMKRSLAYGMFPGFFSHNASQGHYFTRPELYHRDRPLFRRYIPLCRQVAEAGWEPITLAHSDDARVYVERFGRRYLTVFNDSPDRRTVTIHLAGLEASDAQELLSGDTLPIRGGQLQLTLDPEDVRVLQLNGGEPILPSKPS